MISPIVLQLEKPNGVKVNYIKRSDSFYKKTLRAIQHKCEVKQEIYGGHFTYFDEGMDFNHSIDSGSKITIDNREHFGYTVLGV